MYAVTGNFGNYWGGVSIPGTTLVSRKAQLPVQRTDKVRRFLAWFKVLNFLLATTLKHTVNLHNFDFVDQQPTSCEIHLALREE